MGMFVIVDAFGGLVVAPYNAELAGSDTGNNEWLWLQSLGPLIA